MDVIVRLLAHEWKYVALCLRDTAFKGSVVESAVVAKVGVRELSRLADIIESNLPAEKQHRHEPEEEVEEDLLARHREGEL